MQLGTLLSIRGQPPGIERAVRALKKAPGEPAGASAAQRRRLAHTHQTPIVRELPPRSADPPGENPW
jgi:hypothetical protein